VRSKLSLCAKGDTLCEDAALTHVSRHGDRPHARSPMERQRASYSTDKGDRTGSNAENVLPEAARV
jgi:hypothetical protein